MQKILNGLTTTKFWQLKNTETTLEVSKAGFQSTTLSLSYTLFASTSAYKSVLSDCSLIMPRERTLTLSSLLSTNMYLYGSWVFKLRTSFLDCLTSWRSSNRDLLILYYFKRRAEYFSKIKHLVNFCGVSTKNKTNKHIMLSSKLKIFCIQKSL